MSASDDAAIAAMLATKTDEQLAAAFAKAHAHYANLRSHFWKLDVSRTMALLGKSMDDIRAEQARRASAATKARNP